MPIFNIFRKVSAKKMLYCLVPLLTLMSCNTMKKDKFDWLASESAPKNFPMQVIAGQFDYIYANGKGASVPAGKEASNGWGNGLSTWVVGPQFKPLPNKLSITFFSYLENKFYQGEFDLPYEKILALFQAGFYSASARQDMNYDEIIAGISPGGGVAVWVSGRDKIIQVFYGKVAEIEALPWRAVLDAPYSTKTKAESMQTTINESVSKSVLAEIKEKELPLSRWDNYQKRYYWHLNFVTENRPPKMINTVKYVNGESSYYFYPIDDEIAKQTHAIPSRFTYSWESPDGQFIRYHVTLDIDEVTAAFEKLQQKYAVTADEPILLTAYMFENNGNRQLGIAVQHGQKEETEIILQKIKLRVNGVIDPKNPDEFYQD